MNKKIVLITGTNSGFGYLTAKSSAEKGYIVYATMRDIKGRNASKAAELSAIPNIHVVELDVTDTANADKVVADIIAKEGRLDVIVNNAGYFGGGIAESYSVPDLEKMFDVNLKGTWRVIKAALPQLRKQEEGLIINISSGLGRFSSPFMTVYNSTKFAVEGISEALAQEVARTLIAQGADMLLTTSGRGPG